MNEEIKNKVTNLIYEEIEDLQRIIGDIEYKTKQQNISEEELKILLTRVKAAQMELIPEKLRIFQLISENDKTLSVIDKWTRINDFSPEVYRKTEAKLRGANTILRQITTMMSDET